MDSTTSAQEIDDLFGEGWFERVVNGVSEIGELSLEEKIRWIKDHSVHGQTGFFRDVLYLPILETIAIPSFKKRPVKIASVGCSDGREVYSILISNWKRVNEIILHGYDSNSELIAEAKAGGEGMAVNSKGNRINSTYSEQNYKLEEWEKFDSKDSAYTLSSSTWSRSWTDLTMTKTAREKVKFEVHNILDNPLLECYDVILMQNVLCHYTPFGREKILENIGQSLVNNGWLICERCDPGSANAKEEYDTWMKNFSQFGFLKQTTIIPDWYDQNHDVTCWSRVYRKS